MLRLSLLICSLSALALITASQALAYLAPVRPRLEFIIDKAASGTSENAQTLSVRIDSVLTHKFRVSTGMEIPTIASSGRPTDRKTPIGVFQIYSRDIDHVSTTWKNAKMPYSLFFHDGAAIHASEAYEFFGERDSGGCVRVHPANAKLLWDLVERYGVGQTVVVIYDGSL